MAKPTPQGTTYIYALVDPRTKKIRYIGKSDSPIRRLKQHISQAKKYSWKPSAKDCKEIWIQRLLDRQYEPRVVILAEIPKNRWQGAEREWIQRAKDAGCDLYNTAPGGIWIPAKKRRGRKKNILPEFLDKTSPVVYPLLY